MATNTILKKLVIKSENFDKVMKVVMSEGQPIVSEKNLEEMTIPPEVLKQLLENSKKK